MTTKQKIEFGLFIQQRHMSWEQLRDKVVLADRLGFHSCWFEDHLYAPGDPKAPFFEGWTTVSALAACTERIRLGPMVTCNSLRHPALLAKMTSSLDNVSKGRMSLAIGSGSLEAEHHVFGIPWPKLSARSRQLEEAVQIMKRLYTEDEVDFSGKFYQIKGGVMMPKPVQKPHPPIIIGGSNERFTLPIIARWGDGWNCNPGNIRVLEQKVQFLREECRRIGRDPAEIRINEMAVLVLARPQELDEAVASARQRYGPGWAMDVGGFVGSPDTVIRRIEEMAGKGVSLFVFNVADGAQPKTLELFAKEVAPAFA